MTPKRIYAIFLRQLYLLKKGSRLINVFYWSTIDIILWGFITIYLNDVGKTGFNFINVLLGAVILYNFFIRIQFSISISFLEDVWTRNFINLFSTPLSVAEYVSGIIIISILQSILSLVATAIIAILLFSYNLFVLGLYLVPFIFVLFLFGWAIGLFAITLVLRFGPSAEALAWTIPFFFTPFSGIFYPLSALPEWLRPFANLIPSSHVFEGMRSIILSGSFDTSRLYVGLALGLAYFIAVYILVLIVYRTVLRKGLFTRFSTD